LPNKNRLTQQEIKAIVETAHSYGLKVTAHSVTNQSAWDAVKAGVDGIEHGFNLADSTMNLMAKKNVFLVPTENSAKYMKIYSELAKIEDTSWIENYLKFSQERLQKAIKKGIPIIAGSDNYTPIGGTRGESSSDMFLAYFDAGMKPLDILQSATYLSALYMNKESEIGVLKAGNKADLIVVKGNLKTDFINTLNSIVLVVKDGKIYVNKLK
jgi:imidazolonepropionase-like amidohydrolase